MPKSSNNLMRKEIPFFDGVNTLVGSNISKINELSHCENAHSQIIGTVEKRKGTRRLGNDIIATANRGIFWFKNAGNPGMYRVSKVSTEKLYYLKSDGVWTLIAGATANLSGEDYISATFAEEFCYIASGGNYSNFSISPDGTTIKSSGTGGHSLSGSPPAFLINYYKGRLYVGDIYIGGDRRKNLIQKSSYSAGIVALVDGDHASGVTIINVTDTKYLKTGIDIDIYRAGTLIENSANISDTTETTITVGATGAALKSGDEIWLEDTYGAKPKIFAWARNNFSGENIKEYDTFTFPGGQDEPMTMMANVGDVMMLGNPYNLAEWNDSSLQSFDIGIGCTSKRGYVLAKGSLYFVDYSGVYSTGGGLPKLVSSKVQKYFDGATKAGLDAAAAGKKGFSVFFMIGNVTLYNDDGSINKTLTDVMLEYNIRQENWFVHIGVPARDFTTYIHSTDPDRLEYAEDSGGFNIFELFNTELEYTELEIPFRIDTNDITLPKEFENNVYIHKIIVEVERGSAGQCFISLDKKKFYQIDGELEKGCNILQVTSIDKEAAQPPGCRQIKISLRDYTKKKCKISRLAIIYSKTLEEFQK